MCIIDCLSTIVFILPLHLDYTKVIILILWWRNFQLEYWRTFQLVSTIKGAFESFFRFNAYIAKWARKFQAHLPTSLPEKSLDIMQIKTNGVIAYTRSEMCIRDRGR